MNQESAEQFRKRAGVDQPGPLYAVGYKLNVVDFDSGVQFIAVPSLLEGYPLKHTLAAITTAAINVTLSRDTSGWNGLKWLLLLNENDPAETAAAIRQMSVSIRSYPVEDGINPAIPDKIAQNLLWSTGYECDDLAASEISTEFDSFWDYQKDYLDNPGTSFIALEPRHAHSVLADTTIALHRRLEKTKNFWLDPQFIPPQSVIDEIRNAGLTYPSGDDRLAGFRLKVMLHS